MNNKKEAMGAVTAFRRLYARAAAEGRGEVLFGADAAEKSVSVLEKYAVVGTTKAIFCFEFPFIGKPYMDLLIGCEAGDISPPVTFAKEPDPIIRRFFDACTEKRNWAGYAFGYSFDLSASLTAAPGLYVLPPLEQPPENYVPTLLKATGCEDRIKQVMAAFTAAPPVWHPHYAGLMAGRQDTPIRLGFSLMHKDSLRYSANKDDFWRDIESYMDLSFTPEGREILSLLVEGGYLCDLQFDLFPDGNLGDGLGVSVNFGFQSVDPRNSKGFLERGDAKRMMQRIENLGLADTRWRQMDSACCANFRAVRTKDGKRLAGDVITLDGLKVRFKKGRAFLSKGYLLARSSYI